MLSGELIHLDEFSLILRDKTGRIRSLNRKTVKVELTDPLAAHRELLDELPMRISIIFSPTWKPCEEHSRCIGGIVGW